MHRLPFGFLSQYITEKHINQRSKYKIIVDLKDAYVYNNIVEELP